MAVWLALVVLVVSGFVLVGRHDLFVIGGMDAAGFAMTASGALLAVCIAAAFLPQVREASPRLYRKTIRVGAVVLATALGIWLRGPISDGSAAIWSAWGTSIPLPPAVSDRVADWRRAMVPAAATPNGERAVRIRGRTDGHFYAGGLLNGTPATLMVDSGAASILLKSTDARDAGIDISALSFTTPVQTAQGTMYAAPVRLRQLRVGVIETQDIEALVAQPGKLETSLLGMNFLSRLRSYTFSGAFLTLRG